MEKELSIWLGEVNEVRSRLAYLREKVRDTVTETSLDSAVQVQALGSNLLKLSAELDTAESELFEMVDRMPPSARV
jgi:hypothetical protein